MIALSILYTLLFVEMRRRSKSIAPCGPFAIERARIQKRVLMQSFLICFFIFLVAASYAVNGFVHIPLPLTKFATIALQMCSGRK